MKSPYQQITETLQHLTREGVAADWSDAVALRRASMTINRWQQLECGDSNDYQSWHVERDEVTGKPYMVTHPHKGSASRRAYPDKEAGAMKRIKAICERLNCHYYIQGDCRGESLYISICPMTAQDYHRAACIVTA